MTVDEIVKSGETPGIGGKEAIEDGTFKSQIENAQSADIDGVTGATMTTGGVKKAVEAASLMRNRNTCGSDAPNGRVG